MINVTASPAPRNTQARHYIGLVLVLLIGIALRTAMVRQIPPGLYRDEAFTGIDAIATLRDGPRLFYPVSFGREPLFTWLVAASVWLWGATPYATRFPATVSGILTLIALYLTARELWSRRVALLSTAVLAIMLWHILISRVSFRAGLVPLFSALAVWQVARGIRTGRERHWVLGGVLCGVLLYTYVSARAAQLPAAAMLLYAWQRRDRGWLPPARALLLLGLSALVVMLPLLVYTALNPDEVLLRTANVASVFNSETPWRMLWGNLKGTAGMFLVRGDYLPRHNVPLRPVFDPVLGATFVIGLVLALRQFRHSAAAAFLVLWTCAMLLPMVVAEKAPHFLRGLGVLPFLAVFPALGLEWLWQMLHRRTARLAWLGIAIPLLIGLGSSVRGYFVQYPATEDLCFRFECAGAQLASEVNAYLERGWTKGRLSAPPGPVRLDRQVFVQYQLWKDVVNAHYLIADAPSFNVPGDPLIVSSAPDPDLPMLYYGWYDRFFPNHWRADQRAWLPPNSRIELTEGPLTTTHQDPHPHPAYLKFSAVPSELPETRLADLDHRISLVSSCVARSGTELTVRLIWYAGEAPPVDFTVFLHYVRDGEIVAQHDGEPGLGYYPMSAWRPGDQFVDERNLSISEVLPADRAYAGLYFYPTGERVPVLAAAREAMDSRVEITLDLCDS